MRLSNIVILALKGCDPDFKVRLSVALEVSIATIYRYISENNDNLTKAAAIPIIRELVGPDVNLFENEIQDTAA